MISWLETWFPLPPRTCGTFFTGGVWISYGIAYHFNQYSSSHDASFLGHHCRSYTSKFLFHQSLHCTVTKWWLSSDVVSVVWWIWCRHKKWMDSWYINSAFSLSFASVDICWCMTLRAWIFIMRKVVVKTSIGRCRLMPGEGGTRIIVLYKKREKRVGFWG